MKFTKEQITQIAKEVTPKIAHGRETIVFTDGTFTVQTGPLTWEANKPVWVVFSGNCTEKEVFESLWYAYAEAVAIGDWE